MKTIENKTGYKSVNNNGYKVQGANVIRTYEAQIERFYTKSMGVISCLYLRDSDTTYFWLSVDDEAEQVSRPLLLSVNSFLSHKAIKHYLKSYLLENDIRITDAISHIKLENAVLDRELDTIIEISFFPNWVIEKGFELKTFSCG